MLDFFAVRSPLTVFLSVGGVRFFRRAFAFWGFLLLEVLDCRSPLTAFLTGVRFFAARFASDGFSYG